MILVRAAIGIFPVLIVMNIQAVAMVAYMVTHLIYRGCEFLKCQICKWVLGKEGPQ